VAGAALLGAARSEPLSPSHAVRVKRIQASTILAANFIVSPFILDAITAITASHTSYYGSFHRNCKSTAASANPHLQDAIIQVPERAARHGVNEAAAGRPDDWR